MSLCVEALALVYICVYEFVMTTVREVRHMHMKKKQTMTENEPCLRVTSIKLERRRRREEK